MVERGRILRDTNAGPGLVTVGGKQYAFTLENLWRSDVPPRVGMFVDVTFDEGGTPEALRAVSEAQIAKEQAHKALSGALHHSKNMQTGTLKRFGVASIAAEILLLLAFFALPNLRIGGFMGDTPLSGWDATGLNPATMMTNDHGLLSLFCVLCLLAPFAVPFLHKGWARWLYLAPLLFSLANLVATYSGLGRQAKATAAAIGGVFGAGVAGSAAHINEPSLALGSYIVLLAALYLASRSLRPTLLTAPE